MIRNIVWLLAAMGAVISLCVTPARAQQGTFALAERIANSGRAVPAQFDLSFPFELRQDHIVVLVRYGKNRLVRRFLLDNSRPCSVNPKIAREAGVMPMGLNGTLSYGRINELRLGDDTTVVFREVGATIEAPTQGTDCWFSDVDGLLGGNLMRHGNWHIDYVARRIRFTTHPLTPPSGAVTTSFSTNTTTGEVKLDQPVYVHGMPLYDVLLQLNSRVGLAMPASSIATLGRRHAAPVLRVRGVATQLYDTLMLPGKTLVSRADSLTLAGQPLFPALVQSLAKSTRFSVMGARLLVHYDLYIDYENQELALVPRTPAPPRPGTLLETTGMTLMWVQPLKQVRVAMQFDLGSSAGAGLMPNDIIEAVDQVPLVASTAAEYCSLVHELELLTRFQGVALTIRRGNRRFQVRIEKTALL